MLKLVKPNFIRKRQRVMKIANVQATLEKVCVSSSHTIKHTLANKVNKLGVPPF